MAMKADFKLHGLKELDAALAALPREIAKVVALKALAEAAEPMLQEVRATADFVDRKGDLRKSVKATRLNRVKRGTFQLRVGPTAPHAHLVEHGTKAHLVSAKEGSVLAALNRILGHEVMHPGAKAKPFFRPVWDRRVRSMLESLKGKFWTELDKAAAALARKALSGKIPANIARQL